VRACCVGVLCAGAGVMVATWQKLQTQTSLCAAQLTLRGILLPWQ
jgi:hypothetical protein